MPVLKGLGTITKQLGNVLIPGVSLISRGAVIIRWQLFLGYKLNKLLFNQFALKRRAK